MGTILVHLSENGVGLFGAPHGTLLKRPAWNITERTKQMIQNGSYQLIDTNPYSLIPPSQPIQQTPNPYTSPYPPAQQYPTYYQVPIPQYASTQNNTNMCYPQTTVTATPTVQQHYQQQYVYPTQPNVSYQSSSPTETNQVGTYDTFLPIYPQN
ncbi:hypothetical protein GPJ56_000594 [Histomonas meleagridis]|uniref:uncharacterized protein n=1 Tax=Histomonas meleagridis TaxID=135588 RepID=UPI00355A55B7|nr:hypothetical protein GPJ56_000594 [Histomonas meleagridis]KAH0796365.1 hypothetical protein GO595_010258 [Histomonas meleagridis]